MCVNVQAMTYRRIAIQNRLEQSLALSQQVNTSPEPRIDFGIPVDNLLAILAENRTRLAVARATISEAAALGEIPESMMPTIIANAAERGLTPAQYALHMATLFFP